jgi:hypothetical protein
MWIEAQKQILGRIQGFLSPLLKQSVKEKIALGDVTLLRKFCEFNQGLLNEGELISELYLHFEGFEEAARFRLFFDSQNVSGLHKVGFSEQEVGVVWDVLQAASGHLSTESVLHKVVENSSQARKLLGSFKSNGSHC